MLLGGNWDFCLAGLATPWTIAGGVTPVGSGTGSVLLIAQLGSGRMPLAEEMVEFMWSRTPAMMTL
uniref:Uncharacterized protein n=1 Tax=Rhizophora mucronata TaxID=61149 RepID=A0A2P2QWB4_RHIMU